MADILIAVPPLTGHINPLIAVAQELESRGHTIAWVGDAEVLTNAIARHHHTIAVAPFSDPSIEQQSRNVRGLESVKFFYERFCFPLIEHSYRYIEQAIQSFSPDLIICDQQMIAGALAARKHNIKWCTSISTSAAIMKPWDLLDQWIKNQLLSYAKQYAIAFDEERIDLSPYLNIAYTSRQLIGETQPLFDAPYLFVGPSITKKRTAMDFPWHLLKNKQKKIFITLGTVSRDRSNRFYQIMLDALRDSQYQVIMVSADMALRNVADNFIICDRVPQLELLPHMDLVISHSGHNTVCETLSHGIPMVLAPIRDDQPVIAAQVHANQAGEIIRFGKVSVKKAKQVIEQVMKNDSYRAGAKKIQQSFAALGGYRCAADAIETLIQHTNSNTRTYHANTYLE